MARRKKDDDDYEKPDPFAAGENDAADRLREGIDRWENLQVEIEERQADQRKIMRELGGQGFDAKQIKRVIATKKARRRSLEKWEADEMVFQTYCRAIGIATDDY